MLSLRSSLRRPVFSRHLPSFLARSVTRSLPPESEREAEQPPPAETSQTSSGTQNPSDIKNRLRQWTDNTAIAVRVRADDFTSTTKTTFSKLGFHLNKMTGYEEIEGLKRRVVEQESRINEARHAARTAKAAYDVAVLQRSNSQREINDLLQRKHNWSPSDISRFTTLVPQDHSFEQEEAQARVAAHEAEEAVEREFSELMRTILARYHEEQMWSDKIRSASTYGSLAALGLNLLVFVTAIVFVEPWKRRRLAMTFEKKIEEMGRENTLVVEESMKEIARKLEKQTQLFLDAPRSAGVDATPVTLENSDGNIGTARRMWKKTQDPDVGATVASTAVVAAVAGWLLRTWWSAAG